MYKCEGIKYYLNKVQGVMDIEIHTTTTEAIVIIGRIQYYWYMWMIRLYVLDTLV